MIQLYSGRIPRLENNWIILTQLTILIIMTLSTRVSIQWPPDIAGDATKTMVFTTPENHFVDIRIFKQYYQNPDLANNLSFDKVFEMCLSGIEEAISGTNKIQFHQEINSIAIYNSIKSNTPLKFGLPDIGEFSSIANTQDRKEVGKMVNPATGQLQDYIEIWRSLDPVNNSPYKEIREDKTKNYPIFTLIIDNNHYQGKLIRLGNWIQGLIFNKSYDNKNQPLHVIQCYQQEKNHWINLVNYGSSNLFPITFSGSINDTIESDNLVWTCIESTLNHAS